MPETDFAATLQALEQRLLDPELRRRPKDVETLLDDGFAEIGRSGMLWDKAGMLAALEADPGFDGPRTIRDFTARLLADGVALVLYRVPEAATRRSSIWRRSEGRWRLTFQHGTPLPPDAQAGHPPLDGGGPGAQPGALAPGSSPKAG